MKLKIVNMLCLMTILIICIKVENIFANEAIMVAGGGEHSLTLSNDGRVWAWGNNQYGQLGDGTYTNREIPVQVLELTNIIKVSAGNQHCLALRSDGTVWAWGNNGYGQLGDGNTITRITPVQVSGLTDVMCVSAGLNHSLAVKSDGTVWAWGRNINGQLGNGTTISRSIPIQVSNLTDVIEVSAGSNYSMAVKADGTAWAWGRNTSGQLGNGTIVDTSIPMQVLDLADVINIYASLNHSLALKTDGTVWAWGSNSHGKLGNGTTVTSYTPVQVPGLINAKKVSAGSDFSVAMMEDGTIWTWGQNSHGQLGDGTTEGKLSPQQLLNIVSAVDVESGYNHTLVVESNGYIYSWGFNESSQLADGIIDRIIIPQQVYNIGEIIDIGGDFYYSLALKSDGTVWAWGYNSSGQLGDGTTLTRYFPVQVDGLNDVVKIAAGYYHSLAIKTDGTVWTWGSNGYGQLGDGTSISRLSPVEAIGLTNIIEVSGSHGHSMALKSDGTVWTWGHNNYGQLGDGTNDDNSIPTQVQGLMDIIQISAGYNFSMALKSDGTVWAWGQNEVGQLGDGTNINKNIPVQVTGIDDIINISAGGYHSLAVRSDNTVFAWGGNGSCQLGDGTSVNKTTPVQLTGFGDVIEVNGGIYHSTALKSDGTVWAWGYNASGQLGDGSIFRQERPVKTVKIDDVKKVIGGYHCSKALLNNGAVMAWGNNIHGEIGNNTSSIRSLPASIITFGPPRITNVASQSLNDGYGIDDEIQIALTYSNPVTITGTPRILLETGDNDKYAYYISGSGTNKIIFQYEIEEGDEASNLEYSSINALELNEGSIRGEDEVDAVLELPTPEGPGSLSANSIIIVDAVKPVISLNGNNEITIEVGSEYIDEGATASDNIDGDISEDIVVSNSVNVDEAGDYIISYNVCDSIGNNAVETTRVVHVTDLTKPIITLNGDEEITIEVGTEYVDAGPIAHDNVDGDISGSIITTGVVNTNVLGDYILHYNVTDSEGNAAQEVIRTVHVVDTTAPIITLNRQSELTIKTNSIYEEAGASVSDNYDADVEIVITGNVNTGQVGDYTLRYNATDSSGNSAIEKRRTVHVIKQSGSSSSNAVKEEVRQNRTLEKLVGEIVQVVEKSPIDTYDKALEVRDKSSNIAEQAITVNTKEEIKDTHVELQVEEKELELKLDNAQKLNSMLNKQLEDKNIKTVLEKDLLKVKITSATGAENVKVKLPVKKLLEMEQEMNLQINNVTIPISAIKTKQVKEILNNNKKAYLEVEIKNLNQTARLQNYLVYAGNDTLIRQRKIIKEMELCFSIINDQDKSIRIEELNSRVEVNTEINEELSNLEKERLVVFNQEGKCIGGLYNSRDKRMHFKVSKSGIYKIMEEIKSFGDITNNNYRTYIEILASKHLTEGISEEEYGPDMFVTRAQAATFVQRILDKDILEYQGIFKDVAKDKWYYGPVEAIAGIGIIEGDGNKYFNPDKKITNEEFITILMRTYYYLTGEEEKIADIKIKDFENASEYAENKLHAAYVKGILETSSNYDLVPKQEVSRERAARIVINFLRVVQ